MQMNRESVGGRQNTKQSKQLPPVVHYLKDRFQTVAVVSVVIKNCFDLCLLLIMQG